MLNFVIAHIIRGTWAMVTISHFHTLPPTNLPILQKGHTTVEWTWWRKHENANRVSGYLSVILAPFEQCVCGYFWFKRSGNPD